MHHLGPHFHRIMVAPESDSRQRLSQRRHVAEDSRLLAYFALRDSFRPATPNGAVFIESDHSLFAVQNGKELRRFDGDGLLRSTIRLANGVLYFAPIHNTYYTVRTDNGNAIWKLHLPGNDQYSVNLVVSDPFIQLNEERIVYTSISGTIYAVQISNGQVLWSLKSSRDFLEGPAIDNGSNLFY